MLKYFNIEVNRYMTIFNALSLVGGLALFLFGMNYMGSSLEKFGGGKFESVLAKMTDNRFKGVLLGMGVTAIIQSSSAVTVMAVGFVNSSIMSLHQAIGIIMGANNGHRVAFVADRHSKRQYFCCTFEAVVIYAGACFNRYSNAYGCKK